ncbi:hypothetical protein NQ317_018236 [Molorchus minor]|uniref:Uncharacterized protein n=1 Tax=Molorchus minor TaxID=1323400 RepID=A0ABQ9K6M5_9CUCU|nr:hypothetical protein NQ317_018236 [Molorchus minor]
MREILSNKINFVKASNRNDQDSSKEDIDCLIVDNEQTISNGLNKDEEMESDVKVSEHMEWGSRHLYLDSYKGGSGSGVSGSSKTASCTKRRRRKSSDSSDTSVVSISSSHSSSSSSSSDENVILVSSDSESDCNRSKEVKQSGENVKRRKKLKK